MNIRDVQVTNLEALLDAPANGRRARGWASNQAQAWKNSDAFKNFDAELRRSSESTIQLVQGLPTPAAHGIGGRRGRGFNQKAFEPNVKEYDQMLKKMKGICRGC